MTHHECVLRAAAALREALYDHGVTIHADLGRRHGFAPRFEFACTPELVLAALVPTRGLFSRMTCMKSDDLDWRHPDLAVEWQGKRYVVDVCGKNETTMRVARKLETYLHNAHKHPGFVGVSLLVLASDDEHDDLNGPYERLVGSFSRVFGGDALDAEPDTVDVLKPVIAKFGLEAHYGRSDWCRIKEIEVSRSDTNWMDELTDHVLRCFRMRRRTT